MSLFDTHTSYTYCILTRPETWVYFFRGMVYLIFRVSSLETVTV